MYSKLLEMCGFDPQEITKEKDRIEKTFKTLGMGEKEIAAAEERVKQLYSIELPCVRMMLKVWVKELIALVMAREEKEKIFNELLDDFIISTLPYIEKPVFPSRFVLSKLSDIQKRPHRYGNPL